MCYYQVFLRNENIKLHTQGSEVHFHTIDNVFFQNMYLSPGQTIATWSTMHQFWKLNRQNFLPRLVSNQEYGIILWYTSQPEKRLYLKLTFYNQYKERLSQVVLKEEMNTFVVPDGTIHYSIELLNGGLSSFVFKQIILYSIMKTIDKKIVDLGDLLVSDFENPDETDDTLRIIFNEPRLACIHHVDFTSIQSAKNVIQISNVKALSHFYLNDGQIDDRIVDVVKQLIQTYVVNQVVFIGYGPISNFASQLYAKKVLEVPVEVYLARHANVYYPKIYQKIDGYNQLDTWLEKEEKLSVGNSIYYYGEPIDNSFLPDMNMEEMLRICPVWEN